MGKLTFSLQNGSIIATVLRWWGLMKYLQSIEIQEHNKEEVLPGFTQDFPYLATCAELDCYVGAQTPIEN